jgi:hypothetical protein
MWSRVTACLDEKHSKNTRSSSSMDEREAKEVNCGLARYRLLQSGRLTRQMAAELNTARVEKAESPLQCR